MCIRKFWPDMSTALPLVASDAVTLSSAAHPPHVHLCTARRYIPQRWILYIFTVPHMMYLLSQMSDYTTWQWLVVVLHNVVMLAAGGVATVPWLPSTWKGNANAWAMQV